CFVILVREVLDSGVAGPLWPRMQQRMPARSRAPAWPGIFRVLTEPENQLQRRGAAGTQKLYPRRRPGDLSASIRSRKGRTRTSQEHRARGAETPARQTTAVS